jgi:histidinol dehydrogenase
VTLPIFDLSTPAGRGAFEERLSKLRATASASGEAAQTVASIVEDVRTRGDEALVRYMRHWTDPDFSTARIRVTGKELAAAEKQIDPKIRRAIKTSIEHVREYQEHIKPRDPRPVKIGGATLGLRFTPVESVGLTVPGGRAVLFSSLIMLAVPAMVAGVPREAISVINPPPTRREGEPVADISPLVLATCRMLGIERVYRIGGAQAVAALAYGTQSVETVAMVAGPGNVFVQLAKQQLAGLVGSDNGFYGPSEIVTLADTTADPARVAADLIAQAEHDPGKCFLVAWSRRVVERIAAEVERQKAGRRRLAAIEKALANESAAVLAKNQKQALEIADTIAAEHVNLAVKDPRATLAKLKHGGEFFLGDQTPVAAGDYYAGPSHCLPTGTTARFASGISVFTFLKRSGTVEYPRGVDARTIEDIAAMAVAEGLDGHAESVRVRRMR